MSVKGVLSKVGDAALTALVGIGSFEIVALGVKGGINDCNFVGCKVADKAAPIYEKKMFGGVYKTDRWTGESRKLHGAEKNSAKLYMSEHKSSRTSKSTKKESK